MRTRRLALIGSVLIALVLLATLVEGGGLARHGAVTCDTTAGGVQIVPENLTRVTLLVYNNGAATIYLGTGLPSALTTANGVPLIAGAAHDFKPQEYTGAYRCISAGSVELRYEEVLE